LLRGVGTACTGAVECRSEFKSSMSGARSSRAGAHFVAAPAGALSEDVFFSDGESENELSFEHCIATTIPVEKASHGIRRCARSPLCSAFAVLCCQLLLTSLALWQVQALERGKRNGAGKCGHGM